jgi:hypothetical protein
MEAKTESIDAILWRMQTLHFFFLGLQTLHFKQLQGKVEKSCGTKGKHTCVEADYE